MAHVLQAALFMMTFAEERIRQHVCLEEFVKLECLCNAIMNLSTKYRRPNDYPDKPHVALIAGQLAGRGITIQNPFIDFTCTSFCLTDTKDALQRGATNAQRFGRACGMLSHVFARPDRKPILIATEGIMKDAIANELTLCEKAQQIKNGTLISLKDLVTKKDWTRIINKTRIALQHKELKLHTSNDQLIDGVSKNSLQYYFESKNLLVGKMVRFLFLQNRNITFEQFKLGIEYNKSDKQFQDNIDSGRSIKSRYGKIWHMENGKIWMNESIKLYLQRQAYTQNV